MSVLDYIHHKREDGGVLVFVAGMSDIRLLQEKLQTKSEYTVAVAHSRLDIGELMHDQLRSDPKPGTRKVVIATNIAETSFTIPGITFVIDTGHIKRVHGDHEHKISMMRTHWISKSNANQRRGRVGRISPGSCFRLYSKEHYDAMQDVAPCEYISPELEWAYMQILLMSEVGKSLGDPHAFMARWLDPPSPKAVDAAIRSLRAIGALDEQVTHDGLRTTQLTQLGMLSAQLPAFPTTAKMLLYAATVGCLRHVLTFVATERTQNPNAPFEAPLDVGRPSWIHDGRKKMLNIVDGEHYSDHLATSIAFNRYQELCKDPQDTSARLRFGGDGNTYSEEEFVQLYGTDAYGAAKWEDAQPVSDTPAADEFLSEHSLERASLRALNDNRKDVASCLRWVGFDTKDAQEDSDM